MTDIAISYAYDALASAERLAQALELQGWSVWWDRTILPGMSYAETTLQAIEKAKVILVLWSRGSLQSDWVRVEATAGVDRNALIPVLVEDVHPPLAFSHHQVINLLEWNGLPAHPEFQQLVMRIFSLLTLPASAATREEPEAGGNLGVEQKEKPNAEREFQEGSSKKILLPDIDWVEIPAGTFLYGEGSEQQEIHLERFHISRHPITNAQYQTFIDDGGYADEHCWQNLENVETKKPRWDQLNRPRTDVNWYEAVAFTRWLATKLNQSILLPTEQEWEKAARGLNGQAYPWGNDYINGYANVDERGKDGQNLAQTTAVGLYPQGASPYGVMDMAGTVLEWCLNKYNHPEYRDPDTSGEERVLRGGSWSNDTELARVAFRIGRYSHIRSYYWGFRIVLSSPMSS